ncbi:hydroxyacid dehydrogenase [Brachybacterium muris]|uniref:NAD(P)-dependent oxidoreductase n=1 Tax=Brachybacterium muris TaxID=219301 RepID=UPI00223A8A79|nr:NAD(P)-dependent oxidoreductase [Brachybacterium muris]MCT2261853.1 hydroxyacid dehydrogenase [Brachybacterium muris]
MTAIHVAIPARHRRVLFTDSAWARLCALGEVTVLPEDATALPEDLCSTTDVLLTGWDTPHLARVNGDRLRLIVHTSGTWRDALGPEVFASEVTVTQAGSDPMARAVAEFALTMELMLLREAHTYDRGMQTTRDYTASRQPEYGTAIHAVGHGLIGLSRVGLWHLRMLQGLGCTDIVAYDPYISAQRAEQLGVRMVGLEEAMAHPVVALHAPVTPETRGMIGARELALVPDGGIVLNTARAAIVDAAALEAELVAGRLRAGLDVFDQEPLPADSPLYGLPNVLLAPHVAGATREARWEMGDTAVDETERFLHGRDVSHRVDPATVEQLS